MARQVFERNFRVYLLDAVASSDLSEVTETELSEGTHLTPQLTADGVGFNWDNQTASIDMLFEGKIEQRPGTRGLSMNLTFVRDDSADDAWDSFEYGGQGYIVVAPFGEPATGDQLYVLQGAAHDPNPSESAANTFQQFSVEFPCVDWNLNGSLTSGA